MEEYALVTDIVITIEEEAPPLLFDLTALQIEANRLLGLTAAETLNCAQKLYEAQLLTYPRTSSHYITPDMEQAVSSLLSGTEGFSSSNTKQVVNAGGITDHTALLPTKNQALVDFNNLNSNEKGILELVYKNLREATSNPYKYEKTCVTLSYHGEQFTVTGVRNLELGWKKDRLNEAKERLLPTFQKGATVDIKKVSIEERRTEPPGHFTDGKLLKAMENAGKTPSKHDAPFVIFNKTHKNSSPKPRVPGPHGGRLQSHHGLQQEWAKQNLSKYGYKSERAPTVTIETGKGLPHTTISNAQNARRDARVAAGQGKWSSSLQDELSNIVKDFRKAGFSDDTIDKVLKQQYEMFEELGIKYKKINISESTKKT